MQWLELPGPEFRLKFQITYEGGDQYTFTGLATDATVPNKRRPLKAIGTRVDGKVHIALEDVYSLHSEGVDS